MEKGKNEKLKILSPMSDIIFKLLMGTETGKDILSDFLLAVLKLPPHEYDDITIMNPFLLQEYKGDKLGILDVKLKLKSGKVLNIEVQIDPMPFMESRILFYISKLVTEQIGESDQYDKIKPVISIIITGHTLIADSEKYHHHFRLYDVENRVLLTDSLGIYTLEVPKARNVVDEDEDLDLLNWMKFFDIKSEEDADMLATKSPEMRKATVRLMELSADEKARQLYEARLKEQRDNYAREWGAVHGAKIEIAKKLLKRNRPINEIMEDTGLTYDEIESLQNSII
ncbi:MAG: Rpn family recombination-promoting nuclease/putative transposase [Oscillospiraceae bacterium]|nr:Rpn family recombination-promoting nuclease/putative transposase [Oscillospiraceae bacterium]MCL2279910.1 Rpn family recombination-promoting nuclease/putative transposase [Oscillospiraceae bacterium]